VCHNVYNIFVRKLQKYDGNQNSANKAIVNNVQGDPERCVQLRSARRYDAMYICKKEFLGDLNGYQGYIRLFTWTKVLGNYSNRICLRILCVSFSCLPLSLYVDIVIVYAQVRLSGTVLYLPTMQFNSFIQRANNF
jgi:hypothetical protein